MNILFYIDRYPGVGGIENVSTIIANELKKSYNIFVISNTQQENIPCPQFVHLLKMPDAKDELSKSNLLYLINSIHIYQINAIVYQDSYGHTDVNLCKAVEQTGVKLFVFEHNSPLFIYNKRDLDSIMTFKGFLRRILHPLLLYKEIRRKRHLLNNSTKYILLSKQFIPEFCKLVGAQAEDPRIMYINNPAISTEINKSVKKENVILCVSRLAQEKCVDKMLAMWRILSTQLPDWRFTIVGDGPERNRLEQYVSRHSVQRVEFTGFATPTKYYQKAKIFWMTSKYEGWGMTLIEAMQQGCVPIAFKTFSSIVDIVDNDINGYLVSPNDITAFINYTISLADNENQRMSLSNRAKEKINDFSLEKIIKEWTLILNSLNP